VKPNSLLLGLILAAPLLGCSGDNGQIDATARYRVEFPEAVADAVEFPLLLTISLGPQGREEDDSSQSAQRRVVLCAPLDPFVVNDSLRLISANCRRGDFYARATVREIQLEDPKACDEADTDGLLYLSEAEYQRNNLIFAEASTFAFSETDCGPQNGSFDLKLKRLE
jgi:hypothetical protein